MKIVFLAALGAAVGLGAVALAQERGTFGPGAWGPGLYDKSTETTVSGRVNAVERVGVGPGQGTRAILETGGGDTEVLLGPAWYLDRQDAKVTKDDSVEVTGSKVVFAGKEVIVARTVKNGSQTLTLRDGEGLPLWVSGPGRGPGWRGGPPWMRWSRSGTP